MFKGYYVKSGELVQTNDINEFNYTPNALVFILLHISTISSKSKYQDLQWLFSLSD